MASKDQRPPGPGDPPGATRLQQAVAHHQAGRLREAEELYRQILARDPRHPDALHLLGLIAASSGQTAAGIDLIERALAVSPAMAQARFNLAGLLRKAGERTRAAAHYQQALDSDPGYAAAHFALASLHQEAGDAAAAIAGYEAGLRLAPGPTLDNRIGALNNLGSLLLEQGRPEEARARLAEAATQAPRQLSVQVNLARALIACGRAAEGLAAAEGAAALKPDDAAVQTVLAGALQAAGRPDAAAETLQRALAIDPLNRDAAFQFALIRRDQGRYGESLGAFATVLEDDQAQDRHWSSFAALLRQLRFDDHNPGVAGLLLRALARPDLDPQDLATAALSLLRNDPALAAFWTLGAPSDDAARASRIEATVANLDAPLLIGLMERCILPDPGLERVLTAVRHGLLLLVIRGTADSEALLPFALALARQCFLNEYLFDIGAAEETARSALVERLQELGPADPNRSLGLAVCACYQSLGSLPDLEGPGWPAALAGLVRLQVSEPATEAVLAARIESLTPITQGVSEAVRQQYEENPYPRWSGLAHLQPRPLAQVMRQLLPPAALPPESLPDRPSVLIAGCGTGRHAILAARLYEGASVLAIDLSRASLAYAQRQADDLAIANLRFAQGDILALPADLGPFDLIECSGVLHHLGDPLAGWRMLRDRLAPGGLLKVSLYSELARRHVVAARALIAERGWQGSAEDIRRCRAEILARQDEPLFAKLAQGRDFYSLSLCRDLIFHVQEHRFTLPRIVEAMASLELAFLGLEGPDGEMRRRYRARFPDDPDLVDLINWAAFEEREPDCFAEMYQIWMRKTD